MVKKEEILARTSNGLDVFRHYLPVKWRVGRNFLNPLYEDHKASCNVYYDRRSGTYKMKDFGNGEYSGDCFFLVAKLKGLDCRNAADFVEVLHTIDRELGLGLDGEPSPGTPGQPTRTLRLVPSCMGNGNTAATGDTDEDSEDAAALPDGDREAKAYRSPRKNRSRRRSLPTGERRASRKRCWHATGRFRSWSTGAKRKRARHLFKIGQLTGLYQKRGYF